MRQASIAFILISVLINVMGLGLIIPVLPKLIETLAGSTSAASQYNGIFIAVYSLMQFVFAPILGALSDRYGRRPILLISNFGTALDYLIAAVAPSLWWLLVARVIAGILGASFSTANAYIADISKPEERAKNFGLVGAVFGLGFILGPALGGLLGNASLRLPFYFAATLALLNGLYGWFVLPESLKPENRNLKQSSSNPFASLGVLTRIPLIRGLTSSIILFNLAFLILQSVWVLYTTYRFKWGPLDNGLSLMLVGLVSIVAQGWLVRLVIPRWGERRTLLISQANGIVTFSLYGLASQGWMMYSTILLAIVGNLGQPAGQALISKAASEKEQGAVQGALAALVSLTGIVGPLLGGYVFSLVAKPEVASWLAGSPFFIGAVLYVLGFLNTWATFRRIPEVRPVAEEVATGY